MQLHCSIGCQIPLSRKFRAANAAFIDFILYDVDLAATATAKFTPHVKIVWMTDFCSV